MTAMLKFTQASYLYVYENLFLVDKQTFQNTIPVTKVIYDVPKCKLEVFNRSFVQDVLAQWLTYLVCEPQAMSSNPPWGFCSYFLS